MTQPPPGFEEFMARHGFTFAVIGNVLTGEKVFIGDRSSLEADYIVRNLFDDMSMADLNECYRNRLFPAMVQQGIACGLMCKPKEDIFIGLFRNDRRFPTERIDSNLEAESDLRELWLANDRAVSKG